MKRIWLVLFFLLITSLSESAGIVKNQQMMQHKKAQKQQAIVQQRQSQMISQVQNIQKQAKAQRIEQVQEIVDFSNIWEKLQSSSQVWLEIVDEKPKIMIVEDYIAAFASQGIVISKDPQAYVKIIDDLSVQNPQMLNSPFADILRFAAIIEYDYDNGQDRDALAKKVLGPQAYEKNRQRFSSKKNN